MNNSRKWLWFFWLIVLADLFIIAFGYENLRFYIKPLIIPALLLYYYTNAGVLNRFSKILLAGLFFSFLGDVLLLWEEYFIPGLGCFLTTHLLYIAYFIKTAKTSGWQLKKYPLLIVPIAIYAMVLLWLLLPSLGALALPVIIYAVVISVMLLLAVNLYAQVKKEVYTNFIGGAALFVLSDSLLAINKFYRSFSYSGIAIMVTYVLAQYFIVKGSLNQIRKL
ncbi:MAG: lysoplasmalogenase [Sphingobacteriales bacterium]|nr:lysoplasmalogenase [Sphingobacteriales bacterium]